MKKKLLSLVLAGAMVASTSVSAFAADTVTTGKVTITEGENEQNVNIGITGNVLDSQGNIKPGTINVTVPTAVTFTVANNGTLTSADMTITNNSNEKLIVVAKGFEDANGDQDIEVIKRSEFETNGASGTERNKVWLTLEGGTQNLGLTSEHNGKSNGKMYNGEYTSEVLENQNYEIGKIDGNHDMTLRLVGEGGTKEAAGNAIRDRFKLILKVKRDRNV